MFRQALELGQPDLGQAPEAFDAVDMDGSPGELVAGMIDTDVAIRGGPRNSDSLLRWSPDPTGGIWNATKETKLPG